MSRSKQRWCWPTTSRAAGPIALLPKRWCGFRAVARCDDRFATALAWTSESPTAEQLGQEVLAAIYRVAWQQRHGLPTTLRAMLDQEGLAGAFAGQRPSLSADELAKARTIVTGLGDEPPYPQTFAAMYGDEAAEQLGYKALGLAARAGFEVALADALERGLDPLTAVLA
jgi:hypothetical protein